MKKVFILVLTNFFILTLILLSKPVKAQTTEITGQFLYGLQLYVLPEKSTSPDYSTAIYSSTIDENDFLTSGLYQNWLQPRLPDGINGYIYLVDSSHTIKNVYLGGGYLEQGQTLSYPYEPSIEMKHYGAPLIDIFILNPVNKAYFETPTLDYIVYYDTNDGTKPRVKLIDATSNENDYNRVKLAINGYDTGYNSGYFIGYNNGQVDGYNNGYEEGQTSGYNDGYRQGEYDMYNTAYGIGYEQGLQDGSSPGYVELQVYNQLNNTPSATIQTANGSSYEILSSKPCNNNDNDKIFVMGKIDFSLSPNANTSYVIFNVSATGHSNYISNRVNIIDNQFYNIYDFAYANSTISLFGIANTTFAGDEYITYSNYIIINLTKMYGSGNEPTLEQCKDIFISGSYPYSTGEVININYIDGYNEGFSTGYDDGVSYQATQQLTSDGWIKNIFSGIGAFLGLEILPNVTIGLIVGIPFIISVAWFVLKMARGGSAE